MPPVATIGDSGTLFMARSGENSGIGGGQRSSIGVSNPCLVTMLGCPCEELPEEDQDVSKVLC